MTNEDMNIAVAEHLGWKFVPSHDVPSTRGGYPHAVPECWLNPDGDEIYNALEGSNQIGIPNYGEDLNSMAEAIATLPDDNSMHGLVVFCNTLMQICGSHRACVNAKAHQRREAFLRTVGCWKDGGV